MRPAESGSGFRAQYEALRGKGGGPPGRMRLAPASPEALREAMPGRPGAAPGSGPGQAWPGGGPRGRAVRVPEANAGQTTPFAGKGSKKSTGARQPSAFSRPRPSRSMQPERGVSANVFVSPSCFRFWRDRAAQYRQPLPTDLERRRACLPPPLGFLSSARIEHKSNKDRFQPLRRDFFVPPTPPFPAAG